MLPVRHTEFGDHETLWLTIKLARPLSSEAFNRLKVLIDAWFTVGLHGGYGGPQEAEFEEIHDIEYDEEDLWIAWTVRAHHLGTNAVDVLAVVLDSFGNFEAHGDASFFKELVVGFVVVE